MSTLSYAIVTPSFRGDLDRCALLVESVQRWVPEHVSHYLVIDRRDVPMFQHLANARTKILVVEDIVPWWMMRIPRVRKFWLSLCTRPVKNWILQQMVKLSIPSAVTEDVLMYTDSDTFFVQPFEPRDYERDGKVPLFCETGQRGLIDFNDHWHAVGSRLLGLQPQTGEDNNFIGNVIFWRRANALAMQQRIREVSGRSSWQAKIASLRVMSEYITYGLYCTRVLKENSGHYNDGVIRSLNYWLTQPLDIAGLEQLKSQKQDFQHSVMVSAKSRTKVEDIRKVFFS